MPSKYLIYALTDPRTDQWRYIGMSSNGLKRPQMHAMPCYIARHSYKSNWIRSLHALGLTYKIEVLEELSAKEELADAEMEWISEARLRGIALTNLTDGGEGTFGFSRRPGEETRRKMSEAHRGKGLTKEHKRKISEAHIGMAPTLETRRKLSEALKVRICTEETRRKMSSAHKGKTHSEETLGKMSAAQKGRTHTEESRRKISVAAKSRNTLKKVGVSS